MKSLKDEIKKRSAFESLEQEVVLNLMRTADALSRDFEQVFKDGDISPTQYNALRILRGAGEEGLPCGEIASRMITRDPDMTRLLDRLESRGWIARVRGSQDRRVVRVKITPGGLTLLATLDQPVLLGHRRQLAHMKKQQLQLLNQLLQEARNRPEAKDSQ